MTVSEFVFGSVLIFVPSLSLTSAATIAPYVSSGGNYRRPGARQGSCVTLTVVGSTIVPQTLQQKNVYEAVKLAVED
jgi:hypothetical protein